jgi:uncharacterized protein YfaS (alpha-2-macroglobulin family)
MIGRKQLSPWLVAAVLSITACAEGLRPSDSGEEAIAKASEAKPAVVASNATPPGDGENKRTEDVTVDAAGAGTEAAREDSNPLGISTSYCHTKGCLLRLYFGRPMIDATDVAKAPVPKITFDPPQQGTFRWDNPSCVSFKPAEGSFNWGHSITTIVEDAEALDGTALKAPWVHNFTVPFFQVGVKMALWPVKTGQPRFVGIMRGTAGALMGAGPLVLLYDQPVSAKTLADEITLKDENGATIPATVSRPSSVAHFGIDNLDLGHLVAVQAIQTPEDTSIVKVTVPTWRKNGKPSTYSTEVEVATTFQLEKPTLPKGFDASRAPVHFGWELEFSTPVRPEDLKKALIISPKPKSLWTWSYYGTSVTVQAQYEPGTAYTIRLDPALKDMLGNTLTKSPKLAFRTQDRRPHAALGHKAVVYPRKGSSIPVTTTNIRNLTAETFAMGGPKDYIRHIEHGGHCDAADQRGRLVSQRSLRAGGKKNSPTTRTVPVKTRHKHGFVCVVTRGEGIGTESSGPVTSRAAIHLTNLGVTSKVSAREAVIWVTRLNSGQAVKGARVRLLDTKGKDMAVGVTNAKGLATLAVDGKKTSKFRHYILVETANDTAVAKLQSNQFSSAWQFGFKGSVEGRIALSASVFTDRGIYRPGEKVRTKLLVREDSGLQPRQGANVQFSLLDPKGQEVLKRTLNLDQYGAADLEIPLKDTATLGRYSIWVRDGKHSKHASFRVEEYRVPKFAVKVRSLSKEWKHKGTGRVRIGAAYLHGGKLAGRKLHYRIIRTASTVKARGLSGFTFSDPRIAPGLEVLADREVTLDGEGQATVEFNTSHRPEHGPMRYTIEASVTDLDQQTYSAKTSKIVHPAKFYVGIRGGSRSIVEAGKKISVTAIAVNTRGEVVRGKRLRVDLERIQHFTAKRMGGTSGNLIHSQSNTMLRRCDIRSGKTAKTCTFVIPTAGRYRVVARVVPYPGERMQAAFSLTAYGRTRSQWRRFEHERINIVTDKKSYKAGDTARLIVESPFASARGLVTIERDGIVDERLFHIKGDTPTINIPIKEDWTPNVYVSVVLVSPRSHHKKDATGVETGAPSFRLGYTQLKVRPRAASATVNVTLNSAVAAPGEEIDVRLKVLDERGRGTQGSATVWLVDEAVLGLTGYRTPKPLSEFLTPRTLGVKTASNYLDMLWAKKSRNEALYPAGDGDEYELEEEEAGERAPMDVRSLFEATAYWNPTVPVDEDGHATVRIQLPDNLTRWRAIAVFTSKGRLSGSGQASLRTKKPLMVQPSLPRFAYPGDTMEAGATVVNASEEAAPATVTVAGSGFVLDGAKKQTTQTLAPGASSRLSLPLIVGRDKTLDIQIAANLLNHKDAVRRSIPILEPGSKRVILETLEVATDGTLQLDIPAERIEGSVTVDLMVSTTLLSKLKDAVGYLMGYPYGCIEQTTSRAYPLVVLEELLPDMGVQVDKDKLRDYAEAGIKRILSFQTPSGGLSYWPGGRKPHAFGTGFGLTALIAAKKRGFDVPDRALARLSDYLLAVLNNGKIQEEMPHGGLADADTRAFLVMQLGRLGRHQPGLIARLWEARAKMTNFGLSFLSIAAREAAGSEGLSDAILDAIRTDLTVKADEAFVTGKAKGGWSMDSPIRSHAASLLAFAGQPGAGELEHKLLKGLLNRSKRGQWGNTQENVFGIMSVAESVGTTPSSQDSNFQLSVNDRVIPLAKMESLSPRVLRLTLPLLQMGLEKGRQETLRIRLRHGVDKPVHLTARLEYQETLTPANRAPISQGMSIQRNLTTLEGKNISPLTVKLGDVVKVILRIQNDESRNYIAIDDKLPAGFEALNAALANTQTLSSSGLTSEGRRGLRYLSHHELRDERVVFFVDKMPKGNFEYEYLARATTAGTFTRPAATVEAMYDPQATARTSIDTVTIR